MPDNTPKKPARAAAAQQEKSSKAATAPKADGKGTAGQDGQPAGQGGQSAGQQSVQEAEVQPTGEGPGATQVRVRGVKRAVDSGPSVLPHAPPKQIDKGAAKQDSRRRKAIEEREARELRRKAKEMLAESRVLEKAEAKRRRYEDYLEQVADRFHLGADRPVTPIPQLGPGVLQRNLLEVRPETAFIRLSFDEGHNTHLYEVIEPPLEGHEPEVLEFLKDTLVRVLDGRHTVERDGWQKYLEDKTEEAIVDHSIIVDDVSRARLRYHVVRDMLGYGPVDVLMHDPMIEDISCDGPGIPLYVFHREHESIRTNVMFADDLDLDAFVIRLAQRSGKHISIADPLLDATLPDGSRLQATLSREITTRGSSFTVRKFRDDPLTPPDLIRYGTMSAQMAAYFWMLMEEGSSLIYAGGTASGKTTSLNAVCQFIPPEKKVVSIEDTREINLLHENWIAGLTRLGFGGQSSGGQRAGSVDMYKLLEAALRQRPEYMIVGEVRGAEAKTLFQAMATGHAVYSTMHADSVSSAVHRLENPPISVPRILIPIMNAMAVQVQARKDGRLVRRVKEVTEMLGIDPGTGDVLTNGVFRWDGDADRHRYLGSSRCLEHFMERRGLDDRGLEAEWERRTRILQWMADGGMHRITDVHRVVRDYYRRPDAVMKMVEAERGA